MLPVSSIAIVEENDTGHRLTYVRLLVNAALARAVRVHLVLGSRARESRDFVEEIEPLGSRVVVHPHAHFSPDAIAQRARELNVDRVIVPDGDRFAVRLGLSKRWSGDSTLAILLMRGGASTCGRWSLPTAAKSTLKRRLVLRASRIQGVELFQLVLGGDHAPGTTPVPDPVTFAPSTHEVATISDFLATFGPRFWIGVLGRIDERKSLPLVIEALSLLSRIRPVGLAIVGQWSPEIIHARAGIEGRLRKESIPLVVRDDYLRASLFDSWLASLDCIVVSSMGGNPSGTLGKAVLAGTRAVATGADALLDYTLESRGRIAFVTPSVGQVAKAMDEVLSVPRGSAGVASGVDEFCQPLLFSSAGSHYAPGRS